MLVGQMMVGGSRSGLTVTSKQHHSIAAPRILVQQTVVVPIGNTLPDGREHGAVMIAPLQKFERYAWKLTTAPFGPAQSTTMFVGHTSRTQSLVGQRTVTVKVQQAVL